MWSWWCGRVGVPKAIWWNRLTLERVGADVMGTLLVGTPNAGRRQAYYYDYYSAEGLDGPGAPAKPGTDGQSSDSAGSDPFSSDGPEDRESTPDDVRSSS